MKSSLRQQDTQFPWRPQWEYCLPCGSVPLNMNSVQRPSTVSPQSTVITVTSQSTVLSKLSIGIIPSNLLICPLSISHLGSQVAQWVKNLPAVQEMQETWVWSLGWEDPLEQGMATHSKYSCLRNPLDREAWWAMVYWVTKESDATEHARIATP